MSPLLRIGDFGCGTAKLMKEIGYSRVKSFDHVAIDERVIECDIRDLSHYINDWELEIVSLSLSLMGKNWPEYITEAKRCLSIRGSLFIAVATDELSKGRRLSNLPQVLIEKWLCSRSKGTTWGFYNHRGNKNLNIFCCHCTGYTAH
jgi:Hypothetical methyltransferase